MTEKPKRVAVIGAGLAGLTAAYHLQRAGNDVTVLETQSRVGGRALSLQTGLSEGLIAQAGPARFLGSFRRVSHFAREFGLAVLPFYPREYLDGAVYASDMLNGLWKLRALTRP